jgi:hypothetical protein
MRASSVCPDCGCSEATPELIDEQGVTVAVVLTCCDCGCALYVSHRREDSCTD